jgi:membrane fusion protein (multidrug efflux system)
MNLLMFPIRRPFTTLMLVAGLAGGGVLAINSLKLGNLPSLDSLKAYATADSVGTTATQVKEYFVNKFETLFQKHEEEHHEEQRKIVVTTPKTMDLTVTHPYVCQIHSQQHINVCALESGYLQEILVREGQSVKKGDLMFRILPVLYKAKLEAELAEARLAELEYKNTERLFMRKEVVSQNEVLLFKAKLDRAKAKADLAQAEFNFTEVRAPYDGIVDRRHMQLGSLVNEGDLLTTLSDNSVMWVYFNVPEAQYLEYMALPQQEKENQKIELKLANQSMFPHLGKIGAIEAKFNNETGNIAFRADFPNPDRLLRHGQTGTILISRPLKNALVIPQRATFELLDKRYVYVVGEDGVVHQRDISLQQEMDDIFVIDKGLKPGEHIVLEGVRQVRDGEKLEYEFRAPELALSNQKFHAE